MHSIRFLENEARLQIVRPVAKPVVPPHHIVTPIGLFVFQNVFDLNIEIL
jgi:hypothetical protein